MSIAANFQKRDAERIAVRQRGEVFSSSSSLILNVLDFVCILIAIIWLSHAWYYPSLSTLDRAPGVEVLNFLNFGAGVYFLTRLFFVGRLAALLEEKLVLLFFLIGFVNIYFSYSPINTFGFVRAEFLMLVAAIYYRGKVGQARFVALIAEVLGVIIFLSMLASFTSIGVMSGFDSGRWRGLFGHKNSLGEMSAVLFVLLFGLYRFRWSLSWRHLLYAFSALACLAFAGSATSLAVCFVMVAVILQIELIARMGVSAALRISIFLIGMTTVIAFANVILPLVTESLGRDLTFTGRTGIWQAFLFFAEQKPWTGWGWATIAQNEGMLGYIRQTLKLPNIQTPHSGYVALLVELGYPGVIVFATWLLSVLVGSARIALRDRNLLQATRAAIAMGLILHSFFEGTSGATPSIWFLVLLGTGGIVTLKQREGGAQPVRPVAAQRRLS